MNKYEEALKELLANADYVINTSDKKFTLSFDTLRGLGVRNSLMAQRLQELVKRATPMKPINNGYVDFCPICSKSLWQLEESNYCFRCGQAIMRGDK